MNPKAFIGLAAVTAVATAAAVASVVDRYGTVQSSSSQERVVPALVDRINEVAEVSVTFGDGELVVKRKGEGWVLASRNDYPVSAEKVNKAVVQLSQLLLYEPKTKMPERYPRIDVEDIATEKSESKLLRLRDASGGSLAEVIVGKDQYFMAGPSRRGVYLRKSGEAQAWLASGMLEITKNARDFVVRDIMDVHSKRVLSVETIAADGSKLVVARAEPTEEDFKVEDLPAGAKLKPAAPGTLRDMSSALSAIDLNDVLPASEMAFSGADVTRAVVRTFDGLVVDITLTEKEDEEFWARFRASVDPSARPAGTGEDAEPTKKGGEGAGGEADNEAQEGSLKTADEVRGEAEDFNKRVAPWAYNIPYYKGKPLRTRLKDLLSDESGDKSP